MHRARRFPRAFVRMHSHPAEVMPEMRLHERPGLVVERLAGRAQDLMHNWRHERFVRLAIVDLALQPFLAALFALAAWPGRAVTSALAV